MRPEFSTLADFADILRALPDADAAAIREQGIKQGMQPLRISGARKITEGITTMSEVMRVIPRLSDSGEIS